MIDSLYIGMSGMSEFSKGLKLVSNNLSNMSTPGFKASVMHFSNLVNHSDGFSVGRGPAGASGTSGAGLASMGTTLDMSAGDPQNTGNDLDACVDGEGFFVFRQGNEVRYGRTGQFDIDDKGRLINSATQQFVCGMDATGNLTEVSIDAMRLLPQKATGTVRLSGNLKTNPSGTTQTVKRTISVVDPDGKMHSLVLTFTYQGPTEPGVWKVTATESEVPIDIGEVRVGYDSTKAIPSQSKPTVTYKKEGEPTFSFVLDCGETTSNSQDPGALNLLSQDGYVAGSLSGVSFDEEGHLIVRYTNGQTKEGPQVALARFTDPGAMRQVDGGQFAAMGAEAVVTGLAGSGRFGRVLGRYIEGSNVSMEEQFGNLILMQRGYQAASQIVSTANEMMQSLLDARRGG